MFSPSVNNPPAASVRSSRRRQRPLSNEGSIAQPKAKRQRSTLNEKTFVPPNDKVEMEEVKNQNTLLRQDSKGVLGQPRDIAVRGKKPRSGDRGNKGDGSVVLVSSSMGFGRRYWKTVTDVPWLHIDYERDLYCQQASCPPRSSACQCHRSGAILS